MKKPIVFGYVNSLRGPMPQRWDSDGPPQHNHIVAKFALAPEQHKLTLDELCKLYPLTGGEANG